MINIDEQTITQAVVNAFAACPDQRLRSILTSLVHHLHDFAREVNLTEAEWFAGIRFLTEVGHITDAKRQEFIMFSDTLGLSTLVTAQNNRHPEGCTEATVLGPFFVESAAEFEHGADIANGANGVPCYVCGLVKGLDGLPVADAMIDVWQSDDDGLYDEQHADLGHHQARARLHSRSDRSFDFCGARRMAQTAAHLAEHVIAACAGAAVGAVTSDPAFARHSQSTGLTVSGLSYCWLHNPSW